jgi:hypothetical protein
MRGVLVPMIALALDGCGGPVVQQAGSAVEVTRHKLGPLDSLQHCAHLDVGDRLDYRFEASAPVVFDIHYREANALVTPLSRDRTTADSGIFPAMIAADYCMTWQARYGEALLSYRTEVRPPLRSGPVQ